MCLADYISRNLFAKAKKISSFDKLFVVATISTIGDSFKHPIKQNLQTVQKLDNISKSHSPLQTSSRLTAPQTTNLIHGNSQIRITAVAS